MSRTTDVYPDDDQYQQTELERLNECYEENRKLLVRIENTLIEVETKKAHTLQWMEATQKLETRLNELKEALDKKEEQVLTTEKNVKQSLFEVNIAVEKYNRDLADFEVQKAAMIVANTPVRDLIKEILLVLELESDPKALADELRHRHDLYEAKW